ncbi:putative serine protein kinase, PrkA [Desulfatibacillum aliphaticivorans]|uniref:Serine protein kinase, PrkA n=1 Tax=Desulfatibacillum aliphaticivorans TaxID=218208 RepID=B8FIY2_DESAL|nr:serine protein kinase PrkA [Desulfatibacillum aliphaticivorans]ACL04373.1 putative serine protein kinase, PrkA [Desulfatibacillum aliphaticivorans]
MNENPYEQKTKDILDGLCAKIREKEHGAPIPLEQFLQIAASEPDRVFRNILQVFHDMIHSYVGPGSDEYLGDPETINFVYYDTHRLFVEGSDNPFFADRLFANRFIQHVTTFRRGIPQNRIYIFEGPHGSGKSTFLNNLLMKFEQYTKTPAGVSYETIWRIDKNELGAGEIEAAAILKQLKNLVETPGVRGVTPMKGADLAALSNKNYLQVHCPNHDHPIMQIPKAYRRELIDELIDDPVFKKKILYQKQYQWIYRDKPCTICASLFRSLLDVLGAPSKVFKMIYARPYQFNRRLGEGVSVFNPADMIPKSNLLSNLVLQQQLDSLLRSSNQVRYVYSRYAKTNNGIYALMDIKDANKYRFNALHGIISEGVHKLEDVEEDVHSLFLALMNPEDHNQVDQALSFSDRITYIKINYVLDYNTEVKIYKSNFGDQIERRFLPRVLENFAKVIISTRLKTSSEPLLEWIGDPYRYRRYCDRNLLLLKMDIYTGVIPAWLSERDRQAFSAKRRRKVVAESENEGRAGFSGRDSIKIFNEFYTAVAKKGKLINMDMLVNFFRKHQKGQDVIIPEGFMESLVNSYNYMLLQEVKESLYYYNEERISNDIQNYLFAINFEIGREEKCVYTGEKLEITESYLSSMEQRFMGAGVPGQAQLMFREEIQREYASKTLTQEMGLEKKPITETAVYNKLMERYVHNLKEKVMDPFQENENFRNAIKDFGTDAFKTYDRRIREEVSFLMANLQKKYGYTDQGAREICMYVIDKDLAKLFAEPTRPAPPPINPFDGLGAFAITP